MSWTKKSDTAAFHPRVMRLGSSKDVRLLNECWGFLDRALTWSGAHYTDGFLPEHFAVALAPGRASDVVKVAIRAGMLGPKIKDPDGVPGWQILYEVDDLMHIRSKEEVDWEKRHRQQLRDPEIWVPVRVRDGDACRYCGRVVKWYDNKSDRGGTLDHVDPDRDELVVACRKCNSQKQDRTPAQAGMTLLPAPAEPYYSPATVTRLAKFDTTVPARTQPPTGRETQQPARDAAPTGAHAADETDRSPINRSSPVSGQPNRIPPGRDGNGSGPGSGSGVPTQPRAGPSRTRGSRGRRKPPPDQTDPKD
jgi:5-methylcytosine-specific restriction endonuclease McrA